MNNISTGREKIKTAIMALLLVASIVQIGILWGDQSHGIPFNSLLEIFGKPNEENNVDDVVREELFVPYRLIASDGVEDHWIINRQDELQGRLWKNAKLVLKELSGKTPVETFSEASDWGKIVSKKGVVYEFKDSISKELVSWFLGVKGEVPAIYKFMIVPQGEDDKNIEVYVRSLNEKKTCKTDKFLVNRKLWEFNSEEEEKLLAKLSENEKYKTTNYKLFGEIDFDSAMPDVPIAVNEPKFRPYKNLLSKIPEIITHIGGENADEELASIILGYKKDSYSRESFADSAQFKNTDSIYTIYRNGFLDYRYIPGGDSEKGDVDAAIKNAYKFIGRIKQITNVKGNLYLSSIDSTTISDRYVFKFDYIINGSPVFFDMPSNKGFLPIKNAITIEASGKRVLRCKWMLRNLSLADIENEYNVYFMDIVNNDTDGEALKSIYISDLSIGYAAISEKQEEIIPSMIVEKSDSGIYIAKIPIKGD